MTKKNKRAVWLQMFIDDHYMLDVSLYERSELESLKSYLEEFLATGIVPEDLTAAGDYTQEDAEKIGYKS